MFDDGELADISSELLDEDAEDALMSDVFSGFPTSPSEFSRARDEHSQKTTDVEHDMKGMIEDGQALAFSRR